MNLMLNVIADTSGSMYEIGKFHIVMNLLRYISHLKAVDSAGFTSIDFRYFTWSNETAELKTDNGEFPKLIPAGNASLDTLAVLITQLSGDKTPQRFLLVTDGNFGSKGIPEFLKSIGEDASGNMVTIAVGADAQLVKLEQLAGSNQVYLAENVSAAIRSVIHNTRFSAKPPISTGQIKTEDRANPGTNAYA